MKKTKKMMQGVIAAALVSSLAACGQDRPEKPTGYDCDDWDWDEETGTYYCDDYNSSSGGSYYHNGTLYSDKKSLKSSSSYNTYASKYKAGIGSGSKGGFGG